jgi:hypothetical protein
MELIIPFRNTDYSDDGTHLASDRFIMEVQREWEELFYNKFKPFYANAIEGHPSSMLRLTRYMEAGEKTDYDFGMDLIDGEIDIDTNLKIGKFSKVHTVYAIGSQFHENEDEPLLLLKNDGLKEDILVIKYVPDNNGEENETENIPVDSTSMKK